MRTEQNHSSLGQEANEEEEGVVAHYLFQGYNPTDLKTSPTLQTF
jgi:hypothetical protein